MSRFATLYQSLLGKKVIAAITGLILFGFLIGHVTGNLKVFTGATDAGVPHIDEYAHFLRVAGTPLLPAEAVLWGARVVLLISVVLHMTVVIQLAMHSAEARPRDYVKKKRKMASFSALYMMFSGLLIAFFVVFHILHFTTGTIVIGEFEHGYVYNNLQSSFSAAHWYIPAFYIVTMIVIGFHLNHGVWSLFQTLGWDNPDRNKALRAGATIVTVLIVLGFIAVPLSFLSDQMPVYETYAQDLLKH